MLLGDELAFRAYARALPTTWSSWSTPSTHARRRAPRHHGGAQLQAMGHDLLGVRLDSGDLATLSQQARQLLDEAGFPAPASTPATISTRTSLITSLKQQGRASTCGGGHQPVTGQDCPALGGVSWRPPGSPASAGSTAIKLSRAGGQDLHAGHPRGAPLQNPERAGLPADVIHDELLGASRTATASR